VLTVTDPTAGAAAARSAMEHFRAAGARDHLAFAIMNTFHALLMLGDWDSADDEFRQALDSSGTAEYEQLVCGQGWLAALRGDAITAEALLSGLPDMRASEDPQDQATISTSEAFTAAACGRPEDALAHARATLAHTGALGISHETIRWAWPLAARAAGEMGDSAAIRELLELLDGCQPGHLAPMLRAERDLVRARVTAGNADQAAAAFTAVVTGLRDMSTPYHLAHGLLDQAEYLTRMADTEAAAQAIEEARGIAERLGCQPLLDRAGRTTAGKPLPGRFAGREMSGS
jgi:tetratricopeptide (TPR) repeat protein